MGHTGKPSRGCAICRKRKIKCDERPEACSYCIKTKQKCPGYRDLFDLAWRDQRKTAKNNVERRKKATAKQDFVDNSLPNKQRSITSKRFYTNTHLVPWENVPIIGLMQKTEDCAISFYFASYGKAPDNPYEQLTGFQNLIYPLFGLAAEDSALKLSTVALATLFFNTWNAPHPENPLSRSYYVKALAAIKHQLTQKDKCTDDDIIVSILLLGLFEKLVARPRKLQPTTVEARAHLNGALALIKHRGIHNFKNPLSQGLVFEVRSQLIQLSFLGAQQLDEDIGTWAQILEDDQQSPGVKLDTINLDLANLQSEFQSCDSPKHEIQDLELLSKALVINDRLQKWEESLPSSWIPIVVSGPSCIAPSIAAAGLYQPHCTVHRSVFVASIWNRYRVSRIRVLTIIRAYLHTETIHHEQSQQLIDDICATVPFHLGNRMETGVMGDKRVLYPTVRGERMMDEHYTIASAKGGINLLGPLTFLMERMDLRQGQREWIGAQIGRIFKLYRLGV